MVVVVNGQQVEIVSPDEVNSIDLATETPGLEQADVRSAPLAASANVTSLASALSVISGALAGLSVGLFLIRWNSKRISVLELQGRTFAFALDGAGRDSSDFSFYKI